MFYGDPSPSHFDQYHKVKKRIFTLSLATESHNGGKRTAPASNTEKKTLKAVVIMPGTTQGNGKDIRKT